MVDIEHKITVFYEAMLECLFWVNTPDGENNIEFADKDFTDLTADAVDRLRGDARDFVNTYQENIENSSMYHVDVYGNVDYHRAYAYAGHAYYLDRNGYGAGFRDSPKVWGGKENAVLLRDAAEALGELNVYVTNAGEIDIL